jgi:ADP-heptose:LPS heptosyltransferase
MLRHLHKRERDITYVYKLLEEFNMRLDLMLEFLQKSYEAILQLKGLKKFPIGFNSSIFYTQFLFFS